MAEIGKICANWDTTLLEYYYVPVSVALHGTISGGHQMIVRPSFVRYLRARNILMMCEHHTPTHQLVTAGEGY